MKTTPQDAPNGTGDGFTADGFTARALVDGTVRTILCEPVTRLYWIGGRGYVPTPMVKISNAEDPTRHMLVTHADFRRICRECSAQNGL